MTGMHLRSKSSEERDHFLSADGFTSWRRQERFFARAEDGFLSERHRTGFCACNCAYVWEASAEVVALSGCLDKEPIFR